MGWPCHVLRPLADGVRAAAPSDNEHDPSPEIRAEDTKKATRQGGNIGPCQGTASVISVGSRPAGGAAEDATRGVPSGGDLK
jgi:hypothetical protein